MRALVETHYDSRDIHEQLGMGLATYKQVKAGQVPMNPANGLLMARTFLNVDANSLCVLLSALWALNRPKHHLKEQLDLATVLVPALGEVIQRIDSEFSTRTRADSKVPEVHELLNANCHKPLLRYLQTPFPIKEMDDTGRASHLLDRFRGLPSIYYHDILLSIEAASYYPRHYDEDYSRIWEKVNTKKLLSFYGMFDPDVMREITTEENIRKYEGFKYILNPGFGGSHFFVHSNASRSQLDVFEDTLVDNIVKVNGINSAARRKELRLKVMFESKETLRRHSTEVTQELEAMYAGNSILWAFQLGGTTENCVAFRRMKGITEVNGEVLTLAQCDSFVNLMRKIDWNTSNT